jgi:hypothetical protein
VFATETNHRFLTLLTEHLIGNLDELRMPIEPLKPAVLTMPMPWFVNHVETMSAIEQADMTDSEQPITERP